MSKPGPDATTLITGFSDANTAIVSSKDEIDAGLLSRTTFAYRTDCLAVIALRGVKQ